MIIKLMHRDWKWGTSYIFFLRASFDNSVVRAARNNRVSTEIRVEAP